MWDETVMNRAYYMGLQPTAFPSPLEGDPLPLAGKLPSPAWPQQVLA